MLRVLSRFCLTCIVVCAACQSAPRSYAGAEWDRALLFALSDDVLRGTLGVETDSGDLWEIEIGNVSAYVGGSGLEAPRETPGRLKQLVGRRVLAGVRLSEFSFGKAPVVTGWDRLCIAQESSYEPAVAEWEKLRGLAAWKKRAQSYLTGRWARFVDAIQQAPVDEHQALFEDFLRGASRERIAEDIVAWLATGPDVRLWKATIRTREYVLEARDTTDAAIRVLELVLCVPYQSVTRLRRGLEEQGRASWMLLELWKELGPKGMVSEFVCL